MAEERPTNSGLGRFLWENDPKILGLVILRVVFGVVFHKFTTQSLQKATQKTTQKSWNDPWCASITTQKSWNDPLRIYRMTRDDNEGYGCIKFINYLIIG